MQFYQPCYWLLISNWNLLVKMTLFFVFFANHVNSRCPLCLSSAVCLRLNPPVTAFRASSVIPPWTCHQQHLSLIAMGTFSVTPAAKNEACRSARRTEGGLSGMAGLASITMPIETAAQSSVLHGQIRPPDRKGSAARLHSPQWRGENRIWNS